MAIKTVSIVKKKSYHEIGEIEKNFKISDKGEVCLAIGGDGTFLRAAKSFNCPILHIRSGEINSLGFHAGITLSEIKEAIEDLKLGDYFIEKYPKLRITYRNQSYSAVNDVVLFRACSKAIHFLVDYYDEECNQFPLYSGIVRGDGIIFTREIGSTAYNYFARGPVLFDVDAIVVTPISANHIFSIVTNKDFHVRLMKSVAVLECDGVNVAQLNRGDSFTVTKADKVIKVVRLKREEKISDKLARLESF